MRINVLFVTLYTIKSGEPRNLAHIEQLIDAGASLENLNKKQYKTRLVLTEVARQQQWLFDNHRQSIEDRIVSLSQPHIRPIVRGKAS